MDPPRTEGAFAAALPLDGLDAWRIYLGLPMFGSRTPPGGPDEVMRLAFEDAVMNVHGLVAAQAAGEFAAAFAELRERFELGSGAVGLLGGSMGAAIAALVLTESDLDVRAAVLVSPVIELHAAVDAMARRFGAAYDWHENALDVASRLDFVARADDFSQRGQPPILAIVGGDDDEAGFHAPAERLRDALARRYHDRARVALRVVPGMGHALADEPGVEPAPQTTAAKTVDGLAVDWFSRHLPA
jgi:pimeloyl-ACP methyl ester carboxylesterase